MKNNANGLVFHKQSLLLICAEASQIRGDVAIEILEFLLCNFYAALQNGGFLCVKRWLQEIGR